MDSFANKHVLTNAPVGLTLPHPVCFIEDCLILDEFKRVSLHCGRFQYRYGTTPLASDDEAMLAKFFIAESGEIQIAMDDAIPASVLLPVFKVSVVAADAGGAQAVMFEWEFIVLASDLEDLANGPGGMGCGYGTQVDAIPLDAIFTCNCANTIGYV
jgi:hypothetical protein